MGFASLFVTLGLDQKDYQAGMKLAEKTSQGFSKNLRTQLRAATQEAQKMAQQFGMTSPQFIEAAKRAGGLKDELGDIKATIGAFSNDNKIKALTNGLQTASGVASGLYGGFVLLNGESEKTAAVMKNMQALMLVGQGVGQIGELKDAYKQLYAVISANPMVGVVAISVAAGAALIAYGRSVASATAEQRALNDATAAALNKTAEETAKFRLLDGLMRSSTATYKQKYEALQALKALDPQRFKNLSVETYLTGKGTQAVREHIKALEAKARVTAVTELYTEELKKQIKAQQDAANGDNLSWWQAAVVGMTELQKTFSGVNREGDNLSSKSYAQSNLTDFLSESNKRLEVLQKQFEVSTGSAQEFGMTIAEAMDIKLPKEKKVKTKLEQTAVMSGIKTPDFKTGIDKAMKEASATIIRPLNEIKIAAVQMAQQVPPMFQVFTDHLKQSELVAINVSDSIRGAFASMTVGVAESFANMMLGANMDNFFNGLLLQVAGFGKQFGEMLIAQGTAAMIAQATLLTNPALAIAAGVALVGASAIVQKNLSRGMGGVPALAQGGITKGPTLAMIGDNPGGKELVTPLDRLPALMGMVGAGLQGNSRERLVAEVRGDVLQLVLQRTGQRNKRIKGT